jgi:type II secretory pathway pseudopilin PulG
VPIRGLTETREGRLVVIAVVGGTLMIAVAVGNVMMADAADSAAEDVRRHLRRELAAVTDEMIAGYPDSAEAIESLAVDALEGQRASVLGSTRPDGNEVVVAVQSGWGWHMRCIEAELRGDATVLTYVEPRPC